MYGRGLVYFWQREAVLRCGSFVEVLRLFQEVGPWEDAKILAVPHRVVLQIRMTLPHFVVKSVQRAHVSYMLITLIIWLSRKQVTRSWNRNRIEVVFNVNSLAPWVGYNFRTHFCGAFLSDFELVKMTQRLLPPLLQQLYPWRRNIQWRYFRSFIKKHLMRFRFLWFGFGLRTLDLAVLGFFTKNFLPDVF